MLDRTLDLENMERELICIGGIQELQTILP
jgi:hypothetical protein